MWGGVGRCGEVWKVGEGGGRHQAGDEVEQGKLWPGLKHLKVTKDEEMEVEESVVQNIEVLEASEREGGGVKGEKAGGSKEVGAWGVRGQQVVARNPA